MKAAGLAKATAEPQQTTASPQAVPLNRSCSQIHSICRRKKSPVLSTRPFLKSRVSVTCQLTTDVGRCGFLPAAEGNLHYWPGSASEGGPPTSVLTSRACAKAWTSLKDFSLRATTRRAVGRSRTAALEDSKLVLQKTPSKRRSRRLLGQNTQSRFTDDLLLYRYRQGGNFKYRVSIYRQIPQVPS